MVGIIKILSTKKYILKGEELVLMNSRKYTSKERVKVIFEHEEPDRVPLGELAISEKIASKLLGREALVQCGGMFNKLANKLLNEGKRDELVERHSKDTVELNKKLELDLVFLGPRVFSLKYAKLKEIKTNTWITKDNANGIWFKYVYSPESNTYIQVESSINQKGFFELEKYIDSLEQFLEKGCPSDAGEFDVLQNIIDAVGNEKFIVGNIKEPFPIDESWFPLFLEGLIIKPDLIERYVKVLTKLAILKIEKQVRIGVDAIYGGKDWAGRNGLIISPEHFKQFILPYFKEIIDYCHQKNIFYIKHTDGNVMPIIEEFLVDSNVDGFHAIEPAAGMDICKLKKDYGDNVTFIGNIDCAGVLEKGTEEEVKDAVKECIKKVSPGGGHILSSSNSIHSGIPCRNYLAMIEAAKKYGQYPIKI